MKLGNIVTISSVKKEVGKTFFTRNIAGAIAEEGKKVLIIDFTKEENDYINFFKFEKYLDLTKVYIKDLSLQSVKLIYPKNRSISLLINHEDMEFSDEFIKDLINKITKTYDYIFIETNKENQENKNLIQLKKYANQNIIITEPELTSITEVNNIIKELSHIKNHSILVNKLNYKKNKESGVLIDLEDLFQIIDTKFLGVIEYTNKKINLEQPSFFNSHTNTHLSLNRIAKRLINNTYLDKISNINMKSKLSMEILFKKFDIIEKKSF